MPHKVSDETRNRQREAARVRWDPYLRREAIFRKIIALVEGYMLDHNTVDIFTKEQMYALLATMNWRTENPSSPGRDFFDGTEDILR